ncbi:MAG: ankyrin repeat domain-containing protein [Roseivirga sp.]
MSLRFALLRLLLLLLTSLACRNLPHVQPICYQAQAKLAKDRLYLHDKHEEKDKETSLEVSIAPQDALAEKETYQVVSWHLPPGAQGSLLNDQGQPITAGTSLPHGQLRWRYVPQTVGDHSLSITLSDQYGDTATTLCLPMEVLDHKVVPFHVRLQGQRPSVFTCQEATLKLTLTSNDPKARALSYQLEALTTSSGKGHFFFKDGRPLEKGSALTFKEQTLVFAPRKDLALPVATEKLHLVVRNEKGDLASTELTLALEEATYKVQAEVGELQAEQGVPLALRIAAGSPLLHHEKWQLLDYKLVGGLEGTLSEPGSELVHGENRRVLTLSSLALVGPPLLELIVMGLYGEPIPVTVPLTGSCAQFLARQVERLEGQLKKEHTVLAQLLRGTPSLAELEAAQQRAAPFQKEAAATLKTLTANLALLQGEAAARTEQALSALKRGQGQAFTRAEQEVERHISYYQDLSRGINDTDRWGDLPLHDAVSANDLALVQFLLPRTYDINLENNEGQSPLDKASKYSEVYYALQRRGARIGIDGEVRARFGRGVNDCNGEGDTPLIVAVKDNDESAVQLLLRHPKLEIDHGGEGKKNFSALCWAVDFGNLALVKRLVEHGADVNATFHTYQPLYDGQPRGYFYKSTARYNHCPEMRARLQRDTAKDYNQSSAVYETILEYLYCRGARRVPNTEEFYDYEYANSEECAKRLRHFNGP